MSILPPSGTVSSIYRPERRTHERDEETEAQHGSHPPRASQLLCSQVRTRTPHPRPVCQAVQRPVTVPVLQASSGHRAAARAPVWAASSRPLVSICLVHPAALFLS